MVSEGWLLLAVCLLHVLSQAHSYRYIGCFVDKEKRDLPVLGGSGHMYAGKCDRLCRNRNYRYFGLQHSKECWCGNSYGKYGARQSSECRMRCSGNRGSYCGSSWRNSIYATTKPRASTRLPLSKCSQHSVDFNGKCSRAIDGDTNQNYRKKSCTHTRTATGAWWQARTSRRARITSVRIYNRQDCCANRLRNFVIKVDGQVCASYHSSSAFSVKTFRCNAVGRTVRIETRNRVPLTLCEVKVYGRYAEDSRARLPLSKCSQHSVDFNGKCSRAIDGDTNQNYRKKSCTHTRTATGAWWQARTSRRARITSVRIYNRQDCCANRLRNFVIKVDGQVCASYHSSSAFSVKTFRCNAVGRTVRIETRNRVPLTLCEVKVYGRYAEVSTEFLGCYPDDSEFPDFIVAKVSALMTVWKCNKICKAKKFSYFGVKNGQICGCGNEYGNSGDTVKANCNVACGGNPDEKCGGSTNNSVFEVK
ncbi:hypothetical protein BOX15_Mlig029288g1 [Macrostomum lignano]|uniref:WSC domain-containing protein n=2 Tax=Macrostomum lignano TaxID=282301 RepID=A0A1I8J431_9PLAT|nr:hypothetical protein BOX15_Mlig029288g1 [Macrostomum lignano]